MSMGGVISCIVLVEIFHVNRVDRSPALMSEVIPYTILMKIFRVLT